MLQTSAWHPHQDREIWARASANEAVIVSKDEDFAILSNTNASQSPAVVWLRVGNTRRAELLRWFEELLPEVIAALERGERLIEVA